MSIDDNDVPGLTGEETPPLQLEPMGRLGVVIIVAAALLAGCGGAHLPAGRSTRS